MSKKDYQFGRDSIKRRISGVPIAPAILESLEPRLLLSLVAHLELNETSGSTAADTVSNHDGTLSGDTAWDDGRIDNGVYLDGTNDSVSLANSNDFDFGASTSFTVSAWLKDDSDARYAMAISRGNDQPYWNTSEGAGWSIGHYEYVAGRFNLRITDGSNSVNYYTTGQYDPQFYHLVTMVVDRSASMLRCYVDGALDGSTSISSIGSISSSGEALTIGEGYNDWEGVVDDVRIYDEALSANDIESLYNSAPTWMEIYADDGIASEDAPETDIATFRILRTGTLSGAITVNYSISGTASSGDYSETLSGTVTIGDGESYADITVTPVEDAADNGETLTLTLTSGTGYTVGDVGLATATIYDEAGLFAHLAMDETSGSTAADSTGNGFTGTRSGGTVWTDGWIDNGAYLDGSGDYITLANADDIDFGGDQSFTVSVWVRDDGYTYRGVISKGNSYAFLGQKILGAGWGIGNTVQNRFYFGVTDGTTAVYAGTSTYDTGFHLLTMTVDRDADYFYGYVDGQQVISQDISSVGSLGSFSDPVEIGTRFITSTAYWQGVVDDVRIYTYALDSTAVQDLYEETMPPVSIVAVDSMAIEDIADTATFRVSRTGTSGALTVNYSVSGTATSADYSETLSGTVTIADGYSYADIIITPVVDAADDGETLILTLASGTGYRVSDAADEATVTIYDTGELMMRLKLDETSGSTAADDTGNGYTGTRAGGTVWDDGRINNGAYFDGSGDTINVANSDDFDFGASQSFTVSAWVRDDGSGSNAPAVSRGITTAMGYGGTAQGAGWGMGHNNVEDQFVFGISDGTYGTYSGAYAAAGPDDMFHLLTMVVDRSTQLMRCYVDGSLIKSVNISTIGSIDSTGEALQVGGSATWKGMIDDVRVYSYALSTSDVSALYADAPTWAILYATDTVATEDAIGTNSGMFRILRTGSVADTVTVNYSVSGTASSGDYSETLGGMVTIAAGESYADITITPVKDGADDGETVILTLASGTGYTVSDIYSATVTVYDETALLAHLTLDETSGSTAADDTGNGFTGTRLGNTVWTYGRTGNGAYFDGSGDYVTLANADDIDFGEDQSFTVSVWVRDDGSTYRGVISKGNSYAFMGQKTLGAGWAIGNSSQNTFYFGVTDGTNAAYGGGVSNDAGFHLLTMTVDRGAQLLRGYVDGGLTVNLDISSVGSLASFTDPVEIGTRFITGLAYWKGMIDDVRIYSYAMNSAEVESLYEDVPPSVSIEAWDDVASETGSEPATFRITREGSTAEALEVDYTVTGTAAGADYSETLGGTATIAAGESYVDVTITPVDDASSEGNETVIVTLTASTADYAILSTVTGTATVTIDDSDDVAGPQVTIAAVDNDASEDGNDPATFRIYRSSATTSDLAVNYSVSGTAEGDDYSETLSGTVTIASGNSYADITITPVTDSNFEYPETLTLTLTADANYTVGLSDEATAAILDVPFSEQLNPTGDPIGGGVGYSDIIDIGDADYVVDTAGELVAALSSATYGDIIYVEDDAEIDLTGYIADTSYNALFIPSGVTLASGRGYNGSAGGLIYTTDNWSTTYRVAMLGTAGDDIRITGLRIQGPSGYFPAQDTNVTAIGIRCSTSGGGNHKNIEVDNCEIYNWTMAGVYAMSGEGVEIHHNFIHTNIGDGYSYGIWFGGNAYNPIPEWVAEANANLFDCNRHDIGASVHWKWAARYNIFGPQQYQQILDRHTGASVDTWIENNWCQADSGSRVEFRAGFSTDGGGTVFYNNNWTTKETATPGTAMATTAIYTDVTPVPFDTEAADNTFSFDEYDDPYTPVAAFTATMTSTPLTVSFDSSGSYDPEGNDIVAHQWWFGDGSGTQGVVSYEDNPTYTYADPGMYEVIHWAYNEYGVAGYETQTVLVRPEESGYWLSAWVQDVSMASIPTGIYTKQICIDDQVVWEDDVAGDEGWEHVVVDISSYVTVGTGVTLSFRLVNGSSPVGYYAKMGIDNVYIFGGDVIGGQMDSVSMWSETNPGAGWYVDSDATFYGRLATTGGKIEAWAATGTGKIEQYVPIGKALQPMVTDDFESGDGTGGENWDANWVLTGSAAVTSSGTPYDGTYHLLLTGSSAVASRAVDLSDLGGVGTDDVTLSFQYKADSFESGEYVTVEIYDGTQWQEVMAILDGDDDGEYHLASIDLSGYSLTDDFEVRFTASLADASDFFYVDDLMIA